MAVTYFARSYFHLPIQDLRFLHIYHPTPIQCFSQCLQEVSHIYMREVRWASIRHTLLFPPLHSSFPLLHSLGFAGWCCLWAPLPVWMSSAALKIRPCLSTKHFLIPERWCCYLHRGYFSFPFNCSRNSILESIRIGPCNYIIGCRVCQTPWGLTEFVGRNSFHLRTWFRLSEDSNTGN